LKGAKPLNKNVFQRIDEGNSLWKDLIGKDYKYWSAEKEYKLLKRCFQQRHLLQHKDGIVDQEYIEKSGDSDYKVGKKLTISKNDVIIYLKIIGKIGQEILKLTNEENNATKN
jgi:hypothetical protein